MNTLNRHNKIDKNEKSITHVEMESMPDSSNTGYFKRLVTSVRLNGLSETNRAAMAFIIYVMMIALSITITAGGPFENSKSRKVFIWKAIRMLLPSIASMTGFILTFVILVIMIWPLRIRPHILIVFLSFFIWTSAEWLRRASEIDVVCGSLIINGALFKSAGVILLFVLLGLLNFWLHTFN